MKFFVEAVDKKTGMSLQELEDAITKARQCGMHQLCKVTVGVKSQIKSLEFRSEGTESSA